MFVPLEYNFYVTVFLKTILVPHSQHTFTITKTSNKFLGFESSCWSNNGVLWVAALYTGLMFLHLGGDWIFWVDAEVIQGKSLLLVI